MKRRAFCYRVMAAPALALCGWPRPLSGGMAAVARTVIRISTLMTDFERDMRGIEESFNRVGAKLQEAGAAMTNAITLPMLDLASSAQESGARFEAAMREIRVVAHPLP